MILFVAVAAAVTMFVRIDIELAVIGHVGSALVAVTLLYAPVIMAWHRGEDLTTYGFVAAPLGRGIAFGLGIPLLVIFPVFAGGYFLFYDIACNSQTLGVLALPGACARFAGKQGLSPPVLDSDFFYFMIVQVIVVAVPEELLFRGCILHLLERALPPKRRILGGGVGWALVLSAALFAVIHIPKDGDLRSLATFFPGLLFGWMRSATGSILAPVLAHAGSNIFIRTLDQMVLR